MAERQPADIRPNDIRLTESYQAQLEHHRRKPLYTVALVLLGLLLNLGGGRLATHFSWHLFLDSAGTILAAALGGYLPGIAVGYFTNLISTLSGGDAINAYYSIISVFLAVAAAFLSQRGFFKKWWKLLIAAALFALIGGGIGSVVTWLLYGKGFGEGFSAGLAHRLYDGGFGSVFFSQLTADILYDVLDKLLVTALCAAVLLALPAKTARIFDFFRWKLTETKKTRAEAEHHFARLVSLRTKILLLIAVAALLIGAAATAISFLLYRDYTVSDHKKLGQAVADLTASVIDADMVDTYIEQGEEAPGYGEAEQQLYRIRESSPDIEYVYVYQIRGDGCHVVFDLDTEDVPGSDPGEVIPFDVSFTDLLPELLAGRPIDPVITDDTYGWLLTAYSPVYDADGACKCYAAADVSMNQLKTDEYVFMTRVISLFFGFFILVLSIGLWMAETQVVLPINAMALTAGDFAYNSEADRNGNVERIKKLGIHTGDEIENLYNAFTKTTEDTVHYIDDVHQKSQVIEKMQNGLIMVLADMVESRDQCTGDHVRKTAAYVKIIIEQMRRDGYYADQLTDRFMQDVVNSAPLHDVGKIQVSDTLLNKPGRLTDEEFEQMKKHTTAGSDIIERAIAIVPESGYLDEAKNLAEFHHERWDGKGYPTGLKGEDIPLSARIMAVADVFDALVSRRSYKEPFPFEKAMAIIAEEAGTHFDPLVAAAFAHAEDRVRAVAQEHADK